MSESMREEFEAWWSTAGVFQGAKHECWITWQASRAALCVELPHFEHYDDDMVSGAATAINDCQDAIRAAGVKTR